MATQPKAKGGTVLRLIDCQRERLNTKAEAVQRQNQALLRCLLEQNTLGELGAMVLTVDYTNGASPDVWCSGDDAERSMYLASRAAHRINTELDEA